jgi:hypothetical protein
LKNLRTCWRAAPDLPPRENGGARRLHGGCARRLHGGARRLPGLQGEEKKRRPRINLRIAEEMVYCEEKKRREKRERDPEFGAGEMARAGEKEAGAGGRKRRPMRALYARGRIRARRLLFSKLTKYQMHIPSCWR